MVLSDSSGWLANCHDPPGKDMAYRRATRLSPQSIADVLQDAQLVSVFDETQGTFTGMGWCMDPVLANNRQLVHQTEMALET